MVSGVVSGVETVCVVRPGGLAGANGVAGAACAVVAVRPGGVVVATGGVGFGERVTLLGWGLALASLVELE